VSVTFYPFAVDEAPMIFKMEFAYTGVTIKDLRTKMVKYMKGADLMMKVDG
jgi:hypothetical protein